MFLAIHVPMFGQATIDSIPIECPFCPRSKERGTNDWQERDISICNPGDILICQRCRRKVIINWGLEEPDHLSNWISGEKCPHRLCRLKYQELVKEMGWK